MKKTESKEDGAVQLLVTAKKDADVREADLSHLRGTPYADLRDEGSIEVLRGCIP